MQRRSISIKGTTYFRLKRWAVSQRRSVSGSLEEIIKHYLDDAGVAEADETDTRPREQNISEIIDRHFTF